MNSQPPISPPPDGGDNHTHAQQDDRPNDEEEMSSSDEEGEADEDEWTTTGEDSIEDASSEENLSTPSIRESPEIYHDSQGRPVEVIEISSDDEDTSRSQSPVRFEVRGHYHATRYCPDLPLIVKIHDFQIVTDEDKDNEKSVELRVEWADELDPRKKKEWVQEVVVQVHQPSLLYAFWRSRNGRNHATGLELVHLFDILSHLEHHAHGLMFKVQWIGFSTRETSYETVQALVNDHEAIGIVNRYLSDHVVMYEGRRLRQIPVEVELRVAL